jgi:hypothetical protein
MLKLTKWDLFTMETTPLIMNRAVLSYYGKWAQPTENWKKVVF